MNKKIINISCVIIVLFIISFIFINTIKDIKKLSVQNEALGNAVVKKKQQDTNEIIDSTQNIRSKIFHDTDNDINNIVNELKETLSKETLVESINTRISNEIIYIIIDFTQIDTLTAKSIVTNVLSNTNNNYEYRIILTSESNDFPIFGTKAQYVNDIQW